MEDSNRLFHLWPTGLLCPWNFLGKNTGVSCRFLLLGIFLTQGSNPYRSLVSVFMIHLSALLFVYTQKCQCWVVGYTHTFRCTRCCQFPERLKKFILLTSVAQENSSSFSSLSTRVKSFSFFKLSYVKLSTFFWV